jgi:TPP-dependent pyruvate/acetoin dehydrogenase alpha subunit
VDEFFIDGDIDKAVKEAKAGPLPDASELLTDVYVSY